MKLQSQVIASSEQFKTNQAAHEDALRVVRDAAELAAAGGGERSRERHISRGKMLPRDRVANLLDPGSPFLEVGATAAHGLYDGAAPCAGVIAGVGRVMGRQVMVVCNDATVKGGTYYPMTVKKHLRAQEIAEENHLPCIYLVDSGGANLPNQDEVFPDRDHFGRIFYNQARMSAKGIAQIAVVMGSCTAGGAYVPAMSDVAIIVKEQGTIFLAGPPLVKAATGEVVTAEDLGGGDVHTRLSGVADYLAEDDGHALALARRAVGSLGGACTAHTLRQAAEDPAYDPDEIFGVVPGDLRTPYDIREVIARMVDGSYFDEFKPRFGEISGDRLCPCRWLAGGDRRQQWRAVFRGRTERRAFRRAVFAAQDPIGVLAEHHRFHGRAEIRERRHRAARGQDGDGGGLHVCAQDHHAGRRIVRRGQLRHVWARVSAAVPVDLAQQPDFGDGGEQAAGVLATVTRDAKEKRGESWSAEDEAEFKRPTIEMFEKQAHPLYASARLWDDGIIDPRKSRTVLSLSLEAALNAPVEDTRFGVFRM